MRACYWFSSSRGTQCRGDPSFTDTLNPEWIAASGFALLAMTVEFALSQDAALNTSPHPEEPHSGVSKDEGGGKAQTGLPRGSRRGFAAPHHEGIVRGAIKNAHTPHHEGKGDLNCSVIARRGTRRGDPWISECCHQHGLPRRASPSSQ